MRDAHRLDRERGRARNRGEVVSEKDRWMRWNEIHAVAPCMGRSLARRVDAEKAFDQASVRKIAGKENADCNCQKKSTVHFQ